LALEKNKNKTSAHRASFCSSCAETVYMGQQCLFGICHVKEVWAFQQFSSLQGAILPSTVPPEWRRFMTSLSMQRKKTEGHFKGAE